MSNLVQLSEDLARAVASLAPSLLTIPGLAGSATGLAWSADGLVLTTARIATRRDHFDVVLPDGKAAGARVLGRDHARDLAVLRVEAPLTPAPRGDDAALAVGHLVLVLGRPQGDVQATLGMVQRVGGAWTTPAGGVAVERAIEVDAVLPRGFSGGPLVSADGRVVGLNTAGIVRGGTTLPVSTLDAVVPALLERGLVRRGWLGVGVAPAEIAQGRGLLVSSVDRDGPGKALLVGDVILAAGGTPTEEPPALAGVLARAGAGATLELRVVRGGDERTVEVRLGERPRRR